MCPAGGAATNRREREFAMHARSTYRATLVSSATSATFAGRVLDGAGAARSAMDDEESAEQGYWYQGLDFRDVEHCLRDRHFADAPAYWNWRDRD
jgi:hypothetical protein